MSAAEDGPSLGQHLGVAARRRPGPSLATGLAGAGGALVALGVVVLAGERWADTRRPGLSVLLAAAVVAAGLVGMMQPANHLRAAAAAAAGLAAPGLAFFLVAGDGVPSFRQFAVVSGVMLAAMYLVGPWRGHTFHLAILAVAGWLAAVALVDISPWSGLPRGDAFRSLSSVVTDAGAVSMVVGVVYLLAGWWLDREDLKGMATPLLGVGSAALLLGALVVGQSEGDVAGGVLAVASGAALCAVGAVTSRRGTTWAGLVAVALGVIALVDAAAGDESVVLGSVLLAAAGAALVGLAPRVGARLHPAAGSGSGQGGDGGVPSPEGEAAHRRFTL